MIPSPANKANVRTVSSGSVPPPPRVLITDAQELVLLRAFKSLIGTVNINQEAIYVY